MTSPMNNVVANPADGRAESAAQPQSIAVDGWKLREYPVVGSTNLVAAGFGAWEAVRADRQTLGRGRFQRNWVSDEGGLWLSAVVPTDTEGHAGRTLPIAVGLTVCDTLRGFDVHSLRMRWPNDVMVGDHKLAGLLIDQFTNGLAVVGIGINVMNRPEASDPGLKNQTTRLADLVFETPSIREITALLLRNLRRMVNHLATGNFQALPPGVNELWGGSRRVELDLDGVIRSGRFAGVDETGRLRLLDESGTATVFEPWQVRHLQELVDLP
jgi:BirA family biotin operon repressor/biotin-[acetyl-CoA-carboxylase] ligase